MHDEIKILDIEEKTNTFTVWFEVPGEHYNQGFPKRLTHSFPMEPHLLEKNSNGDYEFEKILEKNYLKTGGEEQKKRDCCSRISEAKKEVKGKVKKRKDK